MSAAVGLFLGTQERVRNSCGKQAISVRAAEVLLYIHQPWMEFILTTITVEAQGRCVIAFCGIDVLIIL